MLVFHGKQGFQFKGKTYERGDRIIDAPLEAEIALHPHIMQFFSRRNNPPPSAPSGPAWASVDVAPPVPLSYE